MGRPTVRVLCLPTEADVIEEAERLGVPASRLQGVAGAFGMEAVRLDEVAPEVAAVLQQMVPPHCGLVVAGRAATLTSTLSQGDGEATEPLTPTLSPRERERTAEERESTQDSALSPQHPGPRTQDSAPSTQHPALLLAAPEPLLREMAARLEDAGGEDERAVGAELRTVLDRYRGVGLGVTRCGNLTLEWGRRTYVMGILNISPDSFSGDGLGSSVDAALAQARRFVDEGADLLDVGGESTRPGSEPVSEQEEIDRVVPVIRRLVAELPAPVSIDSYKLPVARAALEAGARMINDIWGLRRSPGLAALATEHDVPIVLMHNRRARAARGRLGGHFQQVQYADLMGEVVLGLWESLRMALRAGVRWENLIVDPGIGFGKTPQQNLVVMRRLRELRSLGRPILMGTSRKSVVGLTLGVPMGERVEGTAATVAVTICNGADIVRVHDVKEMVRVARMTDAIVRVGSE